MSEPQRVGQGFQGFRTSGDVKKESVNDPESFRKIMKTEESQESEQRKQRRYPRAEEEEEVEKPTQEAPDDHLFSNIMDDSKTDDSIYQSSGRGTDASMETSDNPPPESFHDMVKQSNAQRAGSTADSEVTQEDLPREEQRPTTEGTDKKSKPKAKPTEKTTPASKGPAKAKAKPQAKKTMGKRAASTDTHHEVKKAPKEPEPQLEGLEEPKKIKGSAPLNLIQDEEKSVGDKKKSKSTRTKEDEKSRPNERFVQERTDPQPLPTEAPAPSSQQVMGGAAYAHLSSHVFDLFQRMVGIATVEQYKGISKTTITLNLPGSPFDGCKIQLDHYDTAPHSFNLQLLGTPHANQLFTENIDTLNQAFQQGRYAFEVNLMRPILLPQESTKSARVVRRKGEGDSNSDGHEGKK